MFSLRYYKTLLSSVQAVSNGCKFSELQVTPHARVLQSRSFDSANAKQMVSNGNFLLYVFIFNN